MTLLNFIHLINEGHLLHVLVHVCVHEDESNDVSGACSLENGEMDVRCISKDGEPVCKKRTTTYRLEIAEPLGASTPN